MASFLHLFDLQDLRQYEASISLHSSFVSLLFSFPLRNKNIFRQNNFGVFTNNAKRLNETNNFKTLKKL